MASPIFIPDQTRDGDLDKLFEQAVVWAAGPDTATDEDSQLHILSSQLLNNDFDADSDTLALIAVHSSTLGASVLIDASGNIVYDPTAASALQALAPGEFLTDYFDYEISDGNGGFDTGTVSVTVSGLAETAGGSTGTEELTLALSAPDADTLL
jgi:VCBS repeat-containing protein